MQAGERDAAPQVDTPLIAADLVEATVPDHAAAPALPVEPVSEDAPIAEAVANINANMQSGPAQLFLTFAEQIGLFSEAGTAFGPFKDSIAFFEDSQSIDLDIPLGFANIRGNLDLNAFVGFNYEFGLSTGAVNADYNVGVDEDFFKVVGNNLMVDYSSAAFFGSSLEVLPPNIKALVEFPLKFDVSSSGLLIDFVLSDRFDVELVGEEDLGVDSRGKILDFEAALKLIDIDFQDEDEDEDDTTIFSSRDAGLGNTALGDITIRVPTINGGTSLDNDEAGLLPAATFQEAGNNFLDGTIDLDYIAQLGVASALSGGVIGFSQLFSDKAPPDILEFSNKLDSDLDGRIERDEPYRGPGAVNDTKDFAGFTLEGAFLDLEVFGNARLVQTVEFAPQGFLTTLETDEGNIYPLVVGPGETGAINIGADLADDALSGDVSVALVGDYTVRTGLEVGLGLRLDLLKLDLDGFIDAGLLGEFEISETIDFSLPEIELKLPVGTLFSDTRQVFLPAGQVFTLDVDQAPPPDPDPGNQPPEFLTGRFLSVDENQTFVAQLEATDRENDSVSYEILAGPDGLKFNVTPGGALSFTTPQDFEARADANGDNVFQVTVLARDAFGVTTRALNVALRDVDETPPPPPAPGAPNQAPVFDGPATLVVTEGSLRAGQVSARDPEGGTVSFALTGGADRNLFGINAATAEVSFLAPPDFESAADADGDNRYDVEVRASDGAASATREITVLVEDDGILQQAPSGDTIDLEVDIRGISTSTPTPGTPFRLQFRVSNSSPDTAAEPSRAEVYLSDDRMLSADDVLLDSVDVSSVLPGRNQGRIPFLNLEQGTDPGRKFLIVVADVDDDVDETDETNNISSISVIVPDTSPPPMPMPDFVVSGLQSSETTVATGSNLFLRYNVDNISADNAMQTGAVVSFFYSPVGGGADIAVGTDAELSDRLGDRARYISVPEDLAPGTYIVSADVNADLAIDESDFSNNFDGQIIEVVDPAAVPALLPDFRFGDLSISQTAPAPGDSVRIGFQIENTGLGNGRFGPVVTVVLSDDATIDISDRVLTRTAFTTIAAGRGIDAFVDVDLPFDLAPGDFQIGLIADPGELESEEKENNNTRSLAIEIADTAMPELQITAFSPVENVFEPGSESTLFYAIANLGTAPVAAGAASTFFALSTDTGFSPDDIPLNADTGLPEVLQPGESVAREISVTLPASLDPGLYFLLAQADGPEQVDEVFETNNGASFQFEILPPDVSGGLSRSQDVLIAQGEPTDVFRVQTTELANGSYVIAWSDRTSGTQADVFARIFDDEGNSIGGSIRLNSFLNEVQTAPMLTGLNDGTWVVAWESRTQDGDAEGVYAQRFSTTGSKIGAEFRINTITSGRQRSEDIEVLSNGNYLVIYKTPDGGSGADLQGQIYTPAGGKFGSEFTINSGIVRDNTNADIAPLANGGFVVTWRGQDTGASVREIYMQRFNGFGTKLGAETVVRSDSTLNASVSEVASLSDGGYVIAWTEFGGSPPATASRALFRLFDENGVAQGAASVTYEGASVGSIEADGLPDGGFTLSWQDLVDGTREIFRHNFDGDGTARGAAEELTVNTAGSGNGGADIAVTAAGDILYAWEGAGDTIVSRWFPVSGASETPSFAVFPQQPDIVNEGDFGLTAVTFRIARSGQDLDRTDQIDWAAATGSGLLAANDFAGGEVPSGTVTFAPGETERLIEVFIQGDYLREDAEILRIALSNAPEDTRIDQFRADLTVLNDDDGTDLLARNVSSSFDLSADSAIGGYNILGTGSDDNAGRALDIAGDLNGDGLDDILIGAESTSVSGNGSAGRAFAVFGSSTVPPGDVSLGNLSSGGYRVEQLSPNITQLLGFSVAGLGDVNGDGRSDAGFAAPGDDVGSNRGAGSAGIVFGTAPPGTNTRLLENLQSGAGRFITGIDQDDFTFRVIAAAGDVNGDGFADVLGTAPSRAVNLQDDSGEAYVFFGSAAPIWGNTGLLDGERGFRISGTSAGEELGVAAAGGFDFNADGFDDLVIGAPGADPGGLADAGRAYVVFGKSSGFGAVLDVATLDGSNGFVVEGDEAFADTGIAVAGLGDLNGDGFDEVAISAPGRDSGQITVLLGTDNTGSGKRSLDALGEPTARITGTAADTGISVVAAGDVDGDGLDDLLLRSLSNEVHLLFGRADFGGEISLGDLDGRNGVVLNGLAGVVEIGAGGDVNGDGFDDLLIAQEIGGAEQVTVVLGDASLRDGFQVEGGSSINHLEGTLAVGRYQLSTPFGDAELSLSGPDADLFEFVQDGDEYVLSFLDAPQLSGLAGEALDDLYDVTLTAVRAGFRDSLPITVRVVPDDTQDRAPVFVGPANFAFDEGGPVSVSLGAQAFGGRSLTFGLCGGPDETRFSLDPVTGVLSLIAPPDFEQPEDADGDNIYSVEVFVDDGAASAVQQISLAILDVNESFNGTPDEERIIGSPIDDQLEGLAGNDTLEGRGGNDLVDLGLGNDTGDGGAGIDTLSFASLDAPGFVFGDIEVGVIVDLSAQGTAQQTGQGNDIFTNFENLEGSEFADFLTGDGVANAINGGAGGDVLVGGDGDDTLEGGEGFDAVEGGLGADLLFGGTGGNAIEGDLATYFSATGPLVFDFGADVTEILAGSSAEVLEDTIGDDIEGVAGASDHSNTFLASQLTGFSFFLGGSQSDTFVGGSGTDQLIGLAGNDVMYGNDGGDALIGEGGDDDLFGGAGQDFFFFDAVNEGDDTIHDLELGVDFIFFTGGNLVDGDLTFADTVAGGTAATDTLITYEVGGVAGSITVIDHDSTAVEAGAIIVFG